MPCNILASLLVDSTVINIIESELMVLHNGVLNDNYLTLLELSNHFQPSRHAFPCFAIVIDVALSLPTSTARAESCFSTLTSLLRPQRLSMGFSRKSHLVLLAFIRDLTNSLDMEEFVKTFANTSRQLQLK